MRQGVSSFGRELNSGGNGSFSVSEVLIRHICITEYLNELTRYLLYKHT
jgi:hypothetical protein